MIDAESDEPMEILMEITMDQTYHAIQLDGGQRDRLKDTTKLIKKPNGDKILRISMSPGTELPEYIQKKKSLAKKRTFYYVFGRYPSHPF